MNLVHSLALPGFGLGASALAAAPADPTGLPHLRWLNGDQTRQGRHVRLEPGRFALQRVKLYRYR